MTPAPIIQPMMPMDNCYASKTDLISASAGTYTAIMSFSSGPFTPDQLISTHSPDACSKLTLVLMLIPGCSRILARFT